MKLQSILLATAGALALAACGGGNGAANNIATNTTIADPIGGNLGADDFGNGSTLGDPTLGNSSLGGDTNLSGNSLGGSATGNSSTNGSATNTIGNGL